MATKQDIIDAAHETLVGALADVTGASKSELYDNVRLSQRAGESPLPAYTIEVFESPVERGLGNNIHVHDSESIGDKIEVTHRRTKDATFDIAAHAPDDNARRVNELYGAAEAVFEPLVDKPTALHDDVNEVEIQGTQDVSSPQDAVRGDRLRLRIRYHRLFEPSSYEPMESVDVELDIGDLDDEDDEEQVTGEVTFEYNVPDS